MFLNVKFFPNAHIQYSVFPSTQTSCYWEGRKKKLSTNTRSNYSSIQPVIKALAQSHELILWMGNTCSYLLLVNLINFAALQIPLVCNTEESDSLTSQIIPHLSPLSCICTKMLPDVNQIEWCFLLAKDLLLGFVQ